MTESEKTNKAISEINARIRASNGWDWPGAKFGIPREVAKHF